MERSVGVTVDHKSPSLSARMGVPGIVMLMQLVLSISPFAFSIAALVARSINQLDVGDWDGASVAFLNSLLLSLVVSFFTVVIAASLIIFRRRIVEVTVFSLLSLMLPGEFVALGMDRFMAMVSTTGSDVLKTGCFLLSMAGFAFPYVASSLMLTRFSMSESESLVLSEITGSQWEKGLTLLSAYRRDFGLAWIVGVNLIISEVSRTRILSNDLFGLGSHYFGPLVADAFQAHGLEQVYFFLAYVAVGSLVSAMVILSNRAVH